ncbi:MAG: type III-A CRISPR-associated RAMP protein Csm4, partial [Clostridia bacterium]|nr:type III-A CRISPR-associated RAMP protein Csm4 [Clostridia bacterium]
TQYFLGSGSVVRRKFEGDVYEVGENGTHTVYRYSKPIFMEVKL